ncbi:MAG: hypothetical protein R2797_12770 [Gelidibacter sp.]
MILVSKYMVPKGYTGITLFPFVFIKHAQLKENAVFLNHERIHLRQQMELLVVPFFVWYGVEFLIRYLRCRDWNLSYRSISFEHEAYANEECPDYLQKRTFWNFRQYL